MLFKQLVSCLAHSDTQYMAGTTNAVITLHRDVSWHSPGSSFFPSLTLSIQIHLNTGIKQTWVLFPFILRIQLL